MASIVRSRQSHIYMSIMTLCIYKYKNQVGCRDDTMPKKQPLIWAVDLKKEKKMEKIEVWPILYTASNGF